MLGLWRSKHKRKASLLSSVIMDSDGATLLPAAAEPGRAERRQLHPRLWGSLGAAFVAIGE